MAPGDMPEEPRSTSVEAQVLLMLEEPCRILTIWDEGFPHLPRFNYDQKVRPYAPELCCEDLAETLGVPSEPAPFRVLGEAIPPKNDDTLCFLRNPSGAYRVLMIAPTKHINLKAVTEAHAKENGKNAAELTRLAKFRTDVLQNRVRRHRYRFTRVGIGSCVFPCERAYMPLSKRCGHTQIHDGLEFLEKFVRDAGLRVKGIAQRHAWDSTSPVFKIETEKGWYYIKMATPGTRETVLTECIARLFPDDTLSIEAVNLQLSCFISKEFRSSLSIFRFSDYNRIGARRLARIQLQSLDHLETLKEAGLPDYSPSVMSGKIDELAGSPRFSPLMQSEELSLEYVQITMKRFCDELEKDAIPNTLVHGDFAMRNLGVRSELEEDRGMILHDWEGSCVSHPYCDMFSLLDEWWGESFQEEYFSKWSQYVDMEEARRCARMGRVVGAVVRITYLIDLASVSVGSNKEFFLSAVETCLSKMLGLLQDEETEELLGKMGLQKGCLR